MNLSGSWQQGHSATYNTPSRIGRGARLEAWTARAGGWQGLARELAPASRRAPQACPARAGGWQGLARELAPASRRAPLPVLARARELAPGLARAGARPRPGPRGRSPQAFPRGGWLHAGGSQARAGAG